MRLILLLKKFLTCGLLAFCSSVYAISASNTPLEGSNTAVAYILPGAQKISGYNIDTYYHPASTHKLFTALSAVLFLGNDYTFKTKLLIQNSAISNQKIVVNNGTLNSDVLIKFTGDPTLTTNRYLELLSILKNLKINKIQGNVYLDVSRFGEPTRAAGWSWNDLPVCFTAPSAPIILNRNCTYATIQTHGAGRKVTPSVPSGTPIELITDAVGVNARDYGGDCELQTDLYFGNKYHITGCVPIQKNQKPYPLSLAVSDPNQWGLDWTDKFLRRLNIEVTGNIEITKHPKADFIAIGQVKSQPLKNLIAYMLQKSNNLYADAIAKNVAYEYFNLPATYNRTARAIRSILRQYADIDLGNAYLVDASGLSPHNLISPRNLLEVLNYIKKHDKDLDLIGSLPVSGKSGTLHWRASSFDAPLKEHVIAKTGTLQNVSNLAGFVKSKSGSLIPFVMFTNSISYDQRTRDKVKYRRMASPHYKYEKHVLLTIYNEQEITNPQN